MFRSQIIIAIPRNQWITMNVHNRLYLKKSGWFNIPSVWFIITISEIWTCTRPMLSHQVKSSRKCCQIYPFSYPNSRYGNMLSIFLLGQNLIICEVIWFFHKSTVCEKALRQALLITTFDYFSIHQRLHFS